MRKVKVVTDSTCDLSSEMIAAYDLSVVPLSVRFGEEIYLDGVDFDNKKLFQLVEEKKCLPQTAAPTPDDFRRVFQGLLAKDHDVLCVCLSSHLSATVQSAFVAAGECPPGRVEVIDGLNLSSATGILALMAADLAEQGLSLAEMAPVIRSRVPDLRTMFVVDTLEYLHKGGRCSSLENLLASVLKIHPLLTLEGGQIIVTEKIRGSINKSIDRLHQRLMEDREQVQLDYLSVTGAACWDLVGDLVDRIKRDLPVKKVMANEAGCVISSHCGPGTIGILYLANQQKRIA
ncbi:MAG TPA: DegV family protein [Clostridia bacterium]|nr:DegV family protein [Clostridia bacterium]